VADAGEVLRAARTITLVDWVSPDIPRTLVEAGFAVTSINHVRRTASSYSVHPSEDEASKLEGATVFPPGEAGGGYLVCRPLDAMPAEVDIVDVYRPEEELVDIPRLALALGARAVWLQPGVRSAEARRLVEEAGGAFVEDTCIAEAVRELAAKRRRAGS
jgi:hypothetical protein